jgi:hypothetical protein
MRRIAYPQRSAVERVQFIVVLAPQDALAIPVLVEHGFAVKTLAVNKFKIRL